MSAIFSDEMLLWELPILVAASFAVGVSGILLSVHKSMPWWKESLVGICYGGCTAIVPVWLICFIEIWAQQ
jgi:hypothetical protein